MLATLPTPSTPPASATISEVDVVSVGKDEADIGPIKLVEPIIVNVLASND